MTVVNRRRRGRSLRKSRRLGAATVEAAICLPVLVVVWLGAFELNQLVTLRQQTQVVASLTADKVVRSLRSFDFIENEVETIAESLGLQDVQIEIVQVDNQIVESKVTIDFASNSPSNTILRFNEVSSTCYSYRKKEN